MKKGVDEMKKYDLLSSVLAFLFVFVTAAENAEAISAKEVDFSSDAFVESFEGLSEGANILQLTQQGPTPMSSQGPLLMSSMDIPWFQLGTVEPVAFDSGVTMVWRIGLSNTTGAALVGDFLLGPAYTTMLGSYGRNPLDESVNSESDVPDGTAYMTVNGMGELGEVEFAFGSDMYRVGACVNSDYSYEGEPGWVMMLVFDANDQLIETQQIDAVDVSAWNSNFLGVQAEGIRKVRFVGDFLLLDKLMFEPKPEIEPTQAGDLSNVCIFATNSVWLLRGAKIHKGDIVVQGDQEDCSSPPPYLHSNCQVSIGNYAYLTDDVSICADSIRLARKASVGDIQCKYLVNRRGEVRGEELEFTCPEFTMPEFPTPAPGDEYIKLKRGQTRTLEPGSYGEIKMGKKSRLILKGAADGGVARYDLENLDVGTRCKVLFQGPTDLVINNRLQPGCGAYIGPACSAIKEGTLGAKDIRIYVNGTNGNGGNIVDRPKAAVIGRGNRVKACIYAPNGTLWIRLFSKAEGAFYGREVRIGIQTQVTLDNGF